MKYKLAPLHEFESQSTPSKGGVLPVRRKGCKMVLPEGIEPSPSPAVGRSTNWARDNINLAESGGIEPHTFQCRSFQDYFQSLLDTLRIWRKALESNQRPFSPKCLANIRQSHSALPSLKNLVDSQRIELYPKRLQRFVHTSYTWNPHWSDMSDSNWHNLVGSQVC